MIYWQKTNVHGMKCVIESVCVWGVGGGGVVERKERERQTETEKQTDRAR